MGLVPSLPVTSPVQLDLRPFCGDYITSRYTLTEPFAQGEFTYATDGRAAIRTTLPVSDLGKGEGRLPKMGDVWETASRNLTGDRWKPWPVKRWIEHPSKELRLGPWKCPVCIGKGRVGIGVVQCKPCEGTGYQAFPDPTGEGFADYEMPCKYCQHQTGYVGGDVCDYCEGHGSTRKPSLQVVGGRLIDPEFDAKIRVLPGAEFLLSGGGDDVVRFRCHGAEGLLMPIARD
jgi:hypothetical protein